ncbi:MAG: type II toxin-antitoxin system HicB family antitoxin [Alistipes senegalensis]|nr:type II toxin-antitoxin system HicB family antitoxin [Oxalobacter formigenes]MCM1280680.1 type II toxin-antitoxin system HicB family antitoxin [Alistipes senegalensis]
MDAEKYTYRVIWSEQDREFVGLCAEFPSLSWLASTQSAALSGIVNMVKEVIEDMSAQKEDIPVPLSLRSFSGHFLVRTTPETHRRLAIQAQESGVSLNRYINSML